jgi:hypothetical protein
VSKLSSSIGMCIVHVLGEVMNGYSEAIMHFLVRRRHQVSFVGYHSSNYDPVTNMQARLGLYTDMYVRFDADPSCSVAFFLWCCNAPDPCQQAYRYELHSSRGRYLMLFIRARKNRLFSVRSRIPMSNWSNSGINDNRVDGP